MMRDFSFEIRSVQTHESQGTCWRKDGNVVKGRNLTRMMKKEDLYTYSTFKCLRILSELKISSELDWRVTICIKYKYQ